MENPTIDFTDTIAKYNAAYAETVRVPEAVRAQLATAVAAERHRLSAELVKPAPVPTPPAPQPKRTRRGSPATILRQARKAGVVRVEYGGAVYHLTENGTPAAPANPWDTVLPDEGDAHGPH